MTVFQSQNLESRTQGNALRLYKIIKNLTKLILCSIMVLFHEFIIWCCSNEYVNLELRILIRKKYDLILTCMLCLMMFDSNIIIMLLIFDDVVVDDDIFDI